MDWPEACHILGVAESATDAEIKEQYLYKAHLLHPDKNLDKPENIRKKAEAELALVNQAYSFLTNPDNNPYKIPPKLSVEPTGIRFKDVDIGEKKSTTLTIRSVGGPYTSVWIDNNPAPWLVVTGVKSIGSERLPLEVTLECTGTGEPGNQYTSNLLVKLENEHAHTIDQAIINIELYTKIAPAVPGIKEEALRSAKKPTVEVPDYKFLQKKPVPQPIPGKKLGFSVGAFLVNLFIFIVMGALIGYVIYLFLKVDPVFFIIGLIVYAAIAFGISINHAITVGSKALKTKLEN